MKKFTLSLLLLVSFLFLKTDVKAVCNWKSKIKYGTYDTCHRGFGAVTLYNVSCGYLKWTINGTTYAQGPASGGYTSISFPITANGTYNVCVKVSDTCASCDTTLCSTITITCFSSCNWKGKTPTFSAWDTCNSTNARKSVNGSVTFGSTSGASCYKYSWTVNSNAVSGKRNTLSYTITANGTYVICVKVSDTCKKCDTTFCATRTITCFSNSSCNWKGKNGGFASWDTCQGSTGKNSVNGYMVFKSGTCYKYQWTVNNVNAGNGYIMHYNIYNNGTYNVCVKVTDTCTKCDTTYCAVRTISCFGSNCNWKKLSPSFVFHDSCLGNGKNNTINGYISLSSRSCQKYVWTVNGVTQTTKNYYISYPVTANGSYVVCVKVYDTCNKCDTTFCATRGITCFSSSKCNFAGNIGNFYAWDTCKGTGGRNSANAYISLKNSSCFKYNWTVNGSPAGNGYVMHYNISKNGTYAVCVKITDTCHSCDTIICSTRTFTCFPSCHWSSKISNFYAWDTCKGTGGRNSANAYIAFKTSGCYKYQWTVNSALAGKTNIMHYNITKNGTYVVCVKVTDTCNNCDTTLCSTRNFTCFSTSSCNWKAKTPYFYAWDTCQGRGGANSVNAYIGLNSRTCQKYTWTINGVTQSTKNYYINYPIKANGTYVMCVKVTDTCNKCDTTFCTTRSITCFKNCVWAKSNPNMIVYDTCYGGYAAVGGYVSFTNKTCLKYNWTVAGVNAANTQYFGSQVFKNGTYVICVKVTDTCNKCDTTMCINKTINCSSLGLKSSAFNGVEVKVYPNPTKDILNIDWNGSAGSFEVLNVLGSVVYKGELTTGTNTVQTDRWNNGVYIIRVDTGSGLQSFRIVVNR